MDVTLSGGKTVILDLGKISIREYRELLNTKDQDQEDGILAKVAGITVEELLSLPQPDYRRVVDTFFKAAREPLADPNSQSVST